MREIRDSKWKKIGHRLFALLRRAWEGRSLTRFETLVQRITSTTATTGLTIDAEYDAGPYPTGIVVTRGSTSRGMPFMANGTMPLRDYYDGVP